MKKQELEYQIILKHFQKDLIKLLKKTSKMMMLPVMEDVSWQLTEAIDDINIILECTDEDKAIAAKNRLIYLLANKFEEWYT